MRCHAHPSRDEEAREVGKARQTTPVIRPPNGAKVVLMGDRSYASPDLIAWCRRQGWDWRLRLKAELLVFEEGGESTVAECFARGERMLAGVGLTGKRVATNIGMVHEEGHPEPWFIAMSDAQTTATTFDYGLRWGIVMP